jgi:hypothetical protein
MAGVRVTTTTDDLEADLRYIATHARGDMRDTVRDGIRAGNELAKDFAKAKNGPRSHSRKYPGTFSAEMHHGAFGGGSLFGNVISGEYGPRHEGQGELAGILENGSRKGNAAQQNLARSSDIIGPSFAQEVRALPDKWFWPNR